MHFEFERETVRKRRYSEEGSEIVGKLYVDKEAAAALGNPEKIKVTIEAAD
jgi:hypothetical protein